MKGILTSEGLLEGSHNDKTRSVPLRICEDSAVFIDVRVPLTLHPQVLDCQLSTEDVRPQRSQSAGDGPPLGKESVVQALDIFERGKRGKM